MFKYLSSIYITLLVTGIASGFKLLPGKFNFLSKDLHEIALSNTYHGRSQLHMASSDLAAAQDLTKTSIVAPTLNSRKITASITVDSPIEDVWSIITDYDNLAVHVPNLVKSYVVPLGASSTSLPLSTISSIMPNDQKKNSNGEIRIFQEGAQKIVGFDFRASLTLDMKEGIETATSSFTERKLTFKLAESSMFSSFDGTWSVRTVSSSKEFDPISNDYVNKYKSLLTYTVSVKPKGVVPVIALEWRIKEDVPTNLIAMKIAAEKVSFKSKPSISTMKIPKLNNWGADETLGIYTSKKNRTSLPVWTSSSLESTETVELLETSEKLTSVLNAINLDRLNAMLVPAGSAKKSKINSRK